MTAKEATMSAPLTEVQQKGFDAVVRYLKTLVQIGHPCRVTLYMDGRGQLAYDNVEVQARVNLGKPPFSFVTKDNNGRK